MVLVSLTPRRLPLAILRTAASHQLRWSSAGAYTLSTPFRRPSTADRSTAAAKRLTQATPATRLNFASVSNLKGGVRPPRVLITGGLGQLGISLANQLRSRYGVDNVVLSDVRKPDPTLPIAHPLGPFVYADVTNYPLLERIVVDFQIDWVVHYSALLSAVAEKNPARALHVNIQGFQNVLELARLHKLLVFCPSTIGAFGPSTPKDNVPDITIQKPNTIYGITKVHTELLGEYYHEKFGVDFRSVRYPGILSTDTLPGGGTTDYAIDIFHQAIKANRYECFLNPDAKLPMMYIDDCIDGTIQFLEAPSSQLTQRVYNMSADSFSPEEVAAIIKQKYAPGFEMSYAPDFRQAIAETWPATLNDDAARRDWGWRPNLTTDGIVEVMWNGIAQLYKAKPATIQTGAVSQAQVA
ncbi:hypothetical protein H4R34_005224 [Dimargaris verticillata]|uniref:L-threonine 3-dehydrogenase, mitochondrial n=1 Tax=Dimargaris verticillata TaxID=2761393 RepID=A0A9W8B108_9FUNG|nr:hypothetical protein H4R34_005224 [Dimargaris verticillata]